MIPYLYVFILGILSILAPCTIIVLPVLLSRVLDRRDKFRTAVLFSIGFSLTFSVLGAVTGLLGYAIVPQYENALLIFGFMVTFLMALKFLKVIKLEIPQLRLPFKGTNTLFLGIIFGFTALSCISPLLSPVLVFAISQKSISGSILILFIYSMGYSTPLIASSTILDEKTVMEFIEEKRKEVNLLSGILLLLASSYLLLLYLKII